jgi:uncharacterized protein YndB with AHSA1/START domain
MVLRVESVVTLTLTPSTGTHLRMEQSGFRADQQQAYQGAKGGWQQFFAALDTTPVICHLPITLTSAAET